MASSRKLLCSDRLQAEWDACANNYLLPGQTLVVGFSGGLDSVALLHWINSNVPRDRHRISALHVNHGLSPSADDWAEHCRELCLKLDIPLSVVKVSVDRSSKDGLEGAARRARHAAFAQCEADWIVLAHHRGDQAETLLFNLLRGSGVRGASAMRQRNGRLLRPWLGIGRDVIEEYARCACLQWIEDESNADVRFSRNFLRHCVLNKLRERFPAAEERLASSAGQFAEAQLLLEELARIDLAGTPASFPLPVSILSSLSPARAANLLACVLGSHGVGVPSRERLEEVVRQCCTAGADRHPSVRFGEYHLCRRRGFVELQALPGKLSAPIDENENGG